MTNDQDVALPFQLHDDGLEPDDNIAVRFAASVSVVEFVVISALVVFRVFFLVVFSLSLLKTEA